VRGSSWSSSAAVLLIFGWLFLDRKPIENLLPQKVTQNLKIDTPERSEIDFDVVFGTILIFFFIKNRATPKTSILQQIPCGSTILACQRLPFWYQKSI
jgi:hypothetical protein